MHIRQIFSIDPTPLILTVSITALLLIVVLPFLYYAQSQEKLLNQVVDQQEQQLVEQKLQIQMMDTSQALVQDNANLAQNRLNQMVVYENNILANLQILVHSQTVSVNGTR